MKSVMEIRINVSAEAKSKSLVCGRKVAESNDVRVVLENFNGIRFKPTLTVEGTAVESYQALLGLWTEILSLGARPSWMAVGDARAGMSAWVQKLRSLRRGLEAGRENAGRSHRLEKAHAKRISASADSLKKLIPDLNSLRDAAELEVSSAGNTAGFPAFSYYAGLHDALVLALNEHALLARRSADGWIEPVRSFDAGTQVSVAVAISPREGSGVTESREYSVSYLVESKLPIVFHAGFGYTEFSGVTYEKVSTVASGDAFKELSAPSKDVGLTAFLTYLLPSPGGNLRIGATLGTDVDEAKKSLHVGLTVLLAQRFALTGGWTGRDEEEGVNAIGSGLYETVRGLRRDRWFVAFSIVPGR